MKQHLMTQTNLSSESGRSMVEMLGVLAIVGVLSIGGIAGYRFAMAKYQANEVLDGVLKRAAVLSQKVLTDSSGCRNIVTGFPREDNGFDFTASCHDYDGYKILDIHACNLSDDLEPILSNNLPPQVVGFEWAPCGCAFISFRADLSPEPECNGHGGLYPFCGNGFECICLPGWGGDDCSTRL